MKFSDVHVPLGFAWSSPFAKWQTNLKEVSSLDLAYHVTARALADRGLTGADIPRVVLGSTVPQHGTFYATPTLAARLGATASTGPMLSQACATSVACLQLASTELSMGHETDDLTLVVASDRTSNGPLMVYPTELGQGGTPLTESWVLENFREDPWAGVAMIETAENVVRKAGFTREQIDEATALRHQQYASSLDHDREFQRRYMVPVEIALTKRAHVDVSQDCGVRVSDLHALSALPPAVAEGMISYGAQTHPADGAAGLILTSRDRARALSPEGTAQVIATGTARLGAGEMPMAPVPAAQMALNHAGLQISDIDEVTSHNPFVVNDLWFARQTGFPLERMNRRGSSLVFGHPQAPTGLRSIAELIEILRERGGGTGLFVGCAAGDSAMAAVVRVDG